MNDGDELLTAEETAARLKVSLRVLREWRYLRKGPRWLGERRGVRYRRSEVERWIKEQEDAAPAVRSA